MHIRHISLVLRVLDMSLKVILKSALNRALQSVLMSVYNYLHESVQYIPVYCVRSDFLSLHHLSQMGGNLEGQKGVISPFCSICNVL